MDTHGRFFAISAKHDIFDDILIVLLYIIPLQKRGVLEKEEDTFSGID